MRLLLCLIGLGLAGCTAATPAKPKSTPVAPLVGTAHPKLEMVSQERNYTGTVESLNQVAIVPQLAGQLQAVTVNVGDTVHRGEVLGSIDDSQMQAQVSQARATLAAAQSGIQAAMANLAAARDQVAVSDQAVAQAEANVLAVEANITKAEAQVEVTTSTLTRIQAIAKKDLVAPQLVEETAAAAKGARADLRAAIAQHKASQRAYEQARLRTRATRDQVKASLAQVTTAQSQASSQAAALAATELRQKQTSLICPIDGVVISRPLDPGAYVSPSSAAPVLVVASLKNLRVSFQLSEADLQLIKSGQPVEVRYDALPEKKDVGHVHRLAGGLNPSTRTMRVELRLDHPDPELRPGMLARLRLQAPSHKLLTVSIESVVSDGPQQLAWVVDAKDKIARRQIIHVEMVKGDRAWVRDGLKETDLIVVRGIDQLQEGKAVRTEEVKP